ncbi:C6 transcription factor, putative [Penicillium digitatum]|uniref:C6 transcription factor, putative n=1 Tax=Penicillium digitatum TaxID=36651 RepID=A0A7T6XGQ3_PENDI|nr:C6 transcription factor, putative [Penicillium digitatum]
MSEASDKAQPGWRIARACQECRKRKIKCNGLTPCKTCQLRNTPCVYRDYIRHRRKKHEYGEVGERSLPRQGSPSGVPPLGQRTASAMNDFPNSVSATHTASPSCRMQLYYGPTSYFSLMQHIYQDLISNPTSRPEPSGGVEEAGAGLDLFSFRRIFFGTPDCHEKKKSLGKGDLPMMFLPYDLAKLFLSRYLSSLYHLIPLRPKFYYEQCLHRLYNSSPADCLDTPTQSIILLAMASAALGTDHSAWGDVLFERVKASLTAFDDVLFDLFED